MGRLGNLLAAQLTPRDTRPIHEWAAANVETFPPLSVTGKFSVANSRHFIGPFDALDDERTREVNVLAPIRGGKSLIGDVWCVATVSRRPGPFLTVHQTDMDALMMWDDRMSKMLYGCPEVAALMPSPNGKWKWDQFHLGNGQPVYNGGPALSNLQSKPAQYLREEECWMWPQGRMVEAEGRCGDYQRMESNKILRSSQGGPPDGRVLNEDEWYRAYLRGTPHEWETACPHCGKYFDPIFSGQREDGTFWGLTWDQYKLANGDWDLARCIPTVRFECPHCAKPVMDSPRTKQEWNRTGRYRVIGEDTRRRVSFHWEAVIDFPWDELAGLWLDACNAFTRGNLKPKLQFYQKRRAMFKDESSLLRGGLHLKRATYEVNSAWPEEVARFLTVDRQDEDLYWWSVRAWSETVSRRLGFGRCYGETELVDIAEKFKVQPNRVFIDSGYLPKGDHGVYAMCCRQGWIALKGDKPYDYLHTLKNGRRVKRSYAELSWGDPESGIRGEGQRHAPLIRFSKFQMNQKVQELIDSGRWEEPIVGESPELEAEYNEQMAGRVRVVDQEKKTVAWHESPNDHARDLANEQVCAAIVFGCLGDPVETQLTTSEKEK